MCSPVYRGSSLCWKSLKYDHYDFRCCVYKVPDNVVLLHQDLCLTFDRVWKSSEPVGRAWDLGIPLHEPCSDLKFFVHFLLSKEHYCRPKDICQINNISTTWKYFSPRILLHLFTIQQETYEVVAWLVPKALCAVCFNSEPTGIGNNQRNIASWINPHIQMLVKHTHSDFDMINMNVNVHEKKNNISKETHRSSFKTFRKPAVNSQIYVFLVDFYLHELFQSHGADCIDLLKAWLRTAVVTVHCSFAEPVSLGKWGVCHPVRSEHDYSKWKAVDGRYSSCGFSRFGGTPGCVPLSLLCLHKPPQTRVCCWKTHCANSLI